MILLVLCIGATLTLEQALIHTERTQPAVMQARAQMEAAQARELSARGLLMPNLGVNASYSRSTANYAPRPGSVPSSINQASGASLATFDFFSFGASLTQQIYDFHQTIGRYQATQRLSQAAGFVAEQSVVTAFLNTRVAYFAALAQKALVQVQLDNVASLSKHLEDAQAQAEVGRRPQIDVLQAKQQLSSGRLDRIRTDNAYRLAKLSLNQTMGIQQGVDYEVADAEHQALDAELMTPEALTEFVLAERKDVAALDAQIRAQQATVLAQRGRFAPTLGLQLGATESGRALGALVWNLSGQVSLSWTLFSGLQELYGWREAQASEHALQAQRAALVLEARRAVEEARLTVLSNIDAVSAADDACVAARERMALADARYTTGVGTGLEIADARLQLTQANAAKISAQLDLAVARARLLAALGRSR